MAAVKNNVISTIQDLSKIQLLIRSGTDIVVLVFKEPKGSVVSDQIMMLVGRISESDSMSYLQDGGHFAISRRKVLPPGE